MRDRKRQVILVAQQLFIEKGFSATSVQDILDEAKISKGTFYNYFSTKNECLMAIINNGKEEIAMRRQELLIGRSPSDKEVFIEQVSIRQQVNRDRNLIPIFEALFHSGDSELREFAKKHHLAELSWLTSRLADLYGEQAKPYALDCAVLMLGMLHHTMHIKTLSTSDEVDAKQLVAFTMRRIDVVMENMIATSDRLFELESLLTIERESRGYTVTKSQVIEQLKDFQRMIGSSLQCEENQYIEFILEELARETPRPFLLETVTHSLREALLGTDYETEVRELAWNIREYIGVMEKQE